jgi:hypothetical protein
MAMHSMETPAMTMYYGQIEVKVIGQVNKYIITHSPFNSLFYSYPEQQLVIYLCLIV